MKTSCPNCKREFDLENDLGRFYENKGEDYRCLMCRYQGPSELFVPAEKPKKASKMTNEELKSAREESEDNKKNSKSTGSPAKSTKRGVRSERASSDSSGGN